MVGAYMRLGFTPESEGVIIKTCLEHPQPRIRVDFGRDLGVVSGLLLDRVEVIGGPEELEACAND